MKAIFWSAAALASLGFLIGGIALALAPCGGMSLTETYPLAVDNLTGDNRIFHQNAIPITHEIQPNANVLIDAVEGNSGNILNAWYSLDAPNGPWRPLWNQGPQPQFGVTAGSHTWYFLTQWDQDDHGYFTVNIFPFGTKPRAFGWQTCKPVN